MLLFLKVRRADVAKGFDGRQRMAKVTEKFAVAERAQQVCRCLSRPVRESVREAYARQGLAYSNPSDVNVCITS